MRLLNKIVFFNFLCISKSILSGKITKIIDILIKLWNNQKNNIKQFKNFV